MSIKEKFGEKVDIDVKNAQNKEIFGFFEKVMPDYDKERVYATDVKKIINWFNILSANLPELFETKSEE